MDGIHDLGGLIGFGKVEMEEDEPLFQARWEGRVFAMAELCAAHGLIPNVDAFRHAIERMEPVAYLTQGYYGRWLSMVETHMHELGHVSHEEMARSVAERGAEAPQIGVSALCPPYPQNSPPASGSGDAKRSIEQPPRFSAGQAVLARNLSARGHTRLPRYVRGKRGAIHKVHSAWVLPDTNAHGLGENPQYLYTVAFSGSVLWGEGGDPATTVFIDLFEEYLDVV